MSNSHTGTVLNGVHYMVWSLPLLISTSLLSTGLEMI